MKIKTKIIKEIIRDVQFNKQLNAYIDVSTLDNPIQTDLDTIDNPLDGLTYYLPYDWRSEVQSKNQPHDRLVELFLSALKRATKLEKDHVFTKIVKPFITKTNTKNRSNKIDEATTKENMINFIADYSMALDLDNYYYLIDQLIEKYTNYMLYPVNVYTHNSSLFSLMSRFTNSPSLQNKCDAFIIIKKEKDSDTKESKEKELKLKLQYFSDFFNGEIYSFPAYHSLEDAINNENSYDIQIYGSDFLTFKHQLEPELT